MNHDAKFKKDFSLQGEVVRDYRRRKNLSQGELARIIKYKNGQAISNLERGLAGIPEPKVFIICDALGIDKEILLAKMVVDFKNNLVREAIVHYDNFRNTNKANVDKSCEADVQSGQA